MLSFKCKNCAGEMWVSRIGDLACPYCGSKNFFSDKELQEYQTFRLRMLEYLSAVADDEKATEYTERLWSNVETATFTDGEGTDITIQYIYKSKEDDIWMYCARRNVIYLYPKEKRDLANSCIRACGRVTFPQADMKGLNRSFPVLAGRYELKDGSIMLVFAKDENVYPVSMFGSLSAKHVEWIISRLENIACVLTFNNMTHGGITPEAVFINPKTHEAALYGAWYRSWEYVQATGKDLEDIRVTAEKLLGQDYGDAPGPVIRFLQGKPAESAYDDFAMWDEVIEKELGGRHFTQFKM